VVAPPPVHLVKRRVEAVNVRVALIDSVAASAVSNDLHRPEVKPHFEVVQNSAAPVGLGPEGNHDGHMRPGSLCRGHVEPFSFGAVLGLGSHPVDDRARLALAELVRSVVSHDLDVEPVVAVHVEQRGP
jgi:hypothetical protein